MILLLIQLVLLLLALLFIRQEAYFFIYFFFFVGMFILELFLLVYTLSTISSVNPIYNIISYCYLICEKNFFRFISYMPYIIFIIIYMYTYIKNLINTRLYNRIYLFKTILYTIVFFKMLLSIIYLNFFYGSLRLFQLIFNIKKLKYFFALFISLLPSKLSILIVFFMFTYKYFISSTFYFRFALWNRIKLIISSLIIFFNNIFLLFSLFLVFFICSVKFFFLFIFFIYFIYSFFLFQIFFILNFFYFKFSSFKFSKLIIMAFGKIISITYIFFIPIFINYYIFSFLDRFFLSWSLFIYNRSTFFLFLFFFLLQILFLFLIIYSKAHNNFLKIFFYKYRWVVDYYPFKDLPGFIWKYIGIDFNWSVLKFFYFSYWSSYLHNVFFLFNYFYITMQLILYFYSNMLKMTNDLFWAVRDFLRIFDDFIKYYFFNLYYFFFTYISYIYEYFYYIKDISKTWYSYICLTIDNWRLIDYGNSIRRWYKYWMPSFLISFFKVYIHYFNYFFLLNWQDNFWSYYFFFLFRFFKNFVFFLRFKYYTSLFTFWLQMYYRWTNMKLIRFYWYGYFYMYYEI